MKNAKGILMWSGIVLELAGIVLLGRSLGSDSSPAIGIILVSIGVSVMVIGVMQQAKQSEPEPK